MLPICDFFINKFKKSRKAQNILEYLIISRRLSSQTPFFSLNYTTKFKPNFLKQIHAGYRQSILLDFVKTSVVFIFVTYFIAEVDGYILYILLYSFLQVSCFLYIFSVYIFYFCLDIYIFTFLYFYI